MPQGKQGASDAMLERVIREHGDLLDRVAWGYSDNAHDLEDLMQEILMALWRALPGFRSLGSLHSLSGHFVYAATRSWRWRRSTGCWPMIAMGRMQQ